MPRVKTEQELFDIAAGRACSGMPLSELTEMGPGGLTNHVKTLEAYREKSVRRMFDQINFAASGDYRLANAETRLTAALLLLDLCAQHLEEGMPPGHRAQPGTLLAAIRTAIPEADVAPQRHVEMTATVLASALRSHGKMPRNKLPDGGEING